MTNEHPLIQARSAPAVRLGRRGVVQRVIAAAAGAAVTGISGKSPARAAAAFQEADAMIDEPRAIPQSRAAQDDAAGIIHDAEYYILDALHGEAWAVEDEELDAKLAELREKHGTPPNIIHILFDDTGVGEVGIPAIQKLQGFETPNINRLAAEGINFMRMYSEPSCTPTRAAVLTGRLPVRNGMYTPGFPYEYGGLAASEVTMADVLSNAGYATAFYGKWHLGDIEASYATNHGFDEALWMPYNQALSLYNEAGQMNALTAGVLYPELSGKDPYDMDPDWRPTGFVYALEGTKGGPVREFGRAPDYGDYLRIDEESQKRTMAFIQKNAAAKKPFYVAYWPVLTTFLNYPTRLTANGGVMQEGFARFDPWVGELMSELERLGIAENTLVVIGGDNGPMVHDGPPGMVETLYRGGKGDYLEGGVRVPAMAWWPGTIAPGQTVGDIVHLSDLFTTFAHIAGATEYIPTDRIIDGVDQTALFLKGDTFSRRDYVFIYTGPNLAAVVKGRYKRVFMAARDALTSSPFFDLYTDPREMSGKFVEMKPFNSTAELMKIRHELWMEAYPNTPSARDFPFTGLENARPETVAAGQFRVVPAELPLDPREVIENLPGWAGTAFDQTE